MDSCFEEKKNQSLKYKKTEIPLSVELTPPHPHCSIDQKRQCLPVHLPLSACTYYEFNIAEITSLPTENYSPSSDLSSDNHHNHLNSWTVCMRAAFGRVLRPNRLLRARPETKLWGVGGTPVEVCTQQPAEVSIPPAALSRLSQTVYHFI